MVSGKDRSSSAAYPVFDILAGLSCRYCPRLAEYYKHYLLLNDIILLN